MAETETADPEETGEQDEPEPTEEPEQTEDKSGQTPLEDVKGGEPTESEANRENLPDYAEDLPPHMITEDGIDTQEVYKSYQGLIKDMDADVDVDAVLGEDGTINEEELVRQRNELRSKQSDPEDEADTETDDDTPDGEQPESPEDYTLELQDNTIEGESDDPLIKSLRQSAFDAGMSEEQLNNFIQTYEDEAGQLYNERDPDEVLSELSDDPDQAKKIARETRKWIDSKKNTGLLSAEEHSEAIEYVAQTPEGISLLNKLRQIDNQQPIPTDSQASMGESVQEIEQEINETMSQEGYYEPGHPDHERLVSKVNDLHEKKLQLQNQS